MKRRNQGKKHMSQEVGVRGQKFSETEKRSSNSGGKGTGWRGWVLKGKVIEQNGGENRVILGG